MGTDVGGEKLLGVCGSVGRPERWRLSIACRSISLSHPLEVACRLWLG